jgi:hypothetical protein
MALSIHVSIGFAPFPLAVGKQHMTWERVVNLVDMALYMAKSYGRNRAYGVRGFADDQLDSLDAIEQNLVLAWRTGQVELSTVMGGLDSRPLERAADPRGARPVRSRPSGRPTPRRPWRRSPAACHSAHIRRPATGSGPAHTAGRPRRTRHCRCPNSWRRWTPD